MISYVAELGKVTFMACRGGRADNSEVGSVSTSEAIPAPRDVASSKNREVVTTFLQALSQGRYSEAQRLVRPNAQFWTLGKRDFVDAAKWFGGLVSMFPDGLPFNIEGAVSQGRHIAVRCVARGATVAGREFDNPVHFLFEIDGGVIVAAWEYGDTLHAERVFRG
jgi:ketosteroid isomerase-like protein